MTVATWWSSQQSQHEIEGSRFFGNAAPDTRKGAFGGECFYIECKTGDARWFNKSNIRHYCEACASVINAGCEQLGEPLVCSRHV